MSKIRFITLVADNPRSWIHPYVKLLASRLKQKNHRVLIVSDADKIRPGGVTFFLSCEKIVSGEILKKSIHNLVVHESKVPKGRGMSPLTWQIEAGKNKIAITLLEAVEGVDEGDVYLQDYLIFEGHELVDELRKSQGEKTIELVEKFISAYPTLKGKRQKGEPTLYPRRHAKDSEIDINQTIKQQFNTLRVVDNERYPATFKYKGKEYILKIYKK